jgi:diguanylate cyclase (GGDEF)-like protein
MTRMGSSQTQFDDFVLSRRINDYARTVPVEALTGLLCVIIAFWSQFEARQAVLVTSWLIVMVVLQGGRGLHPLITKPTLSDRAGKRRFWRMAMTIAIVNSLGWTAGFAMFGYYADPSQFALICVLVGGMGAGAVLAFRAAPIAAYVDVLSVTAGGLAAVALAQFEYKLAIGLIFGCGAAFLLFSVREEEQIYISRLRKDIDLQRSHETIGLLLNEYETNASDWLWSTDSDGTLREVSPRFGEAAGRSRSLLEGLKICELFEAGQERDLLREYLRTGAPFRDLTLTIMVDRRPRYWTISAQPGEHGGMRGFASDVTRSRIAEDRATYLAHYDSKTELPNRLLFEETLAEAADEHDPSGLAVLHIDLDHFKATNDTLGHASGDMLVRAAARRIKRLVQESDLLARIGGDEFAVLLRCVDREDQARELADRILDVMREPFLVDGQTVISPASIGIAFDRLRDFSAADLLRQANLALHAAKEEGRNCMAIFAPELDAEARSRRELELDLRMAISREQFELHYQPQLDLESGMIAGVEALLRWAHPDRGIVMPDAFIAVAEETGLIVPLGEWIVLNALEDAVEWPEASRIAINLSPAQMRNSQLVSAVASALASTGIDPARVEFEITENILMQDSEANLATLHKLKSLGIRIALDDFGTGFSSLNYLRAFPFDKIKIDRCFVEDLESHPGNQAILRSTIQLAQALGMDTVAEGVETSAQLEWLRRVGCNHAQGFLVSRPLPKSELDDGRSVSEERASLWNYRHSVDEPSANIARLFPGSARSSG